MRSRLVIVVVAAGAVAAACSSSHGAGGSRSSSSSSSSSATGAPAAVTVSVSGGRLTAPNGHTLYYNTVDTASSIGCVGGCASTWPPLLGQPTAGTGVGAGDLGTATRPGGGVQVTFQGHPLYEFDGDTAAGSAKGSGLADGGGRWVVASAGASTASTPASSSPAGSSPAGGGGGYGGY